MVVKEDVEGDRCCECADSEEVAFYRGGLEEGGGPERGHGAIFESVRIGVGDCGCAGSVSVYALLARCGRMCLGSGA